MSTVDYSLIQAFELASPDHTLTFSAECIGAFKNSAQSIKRELNGCRALVNIAHDHEKKSLDAWKKEEARAVAAENELCRQQAEWRNVHGAFLQEIERLNAANRGLLEETNRLNTANKNLLADKERVAQVAEDLRRLMDMRDLYDPGENFALVKSLDDAVSALLESLR